jgi:sulfite exporter TauE/SafE
MSVSELQTEQPLVQSALASLPITAPAQMPSPVAKVQQPAFRIISAILIALGLTGGLAFMQHKLQTLPKTNGATSQLVPPMDRNLGSKSTAIEEMTNHG